MDIRNVITILFLYVTEFNTKRFCDQLQDLGIRVAMDITDSIPVFVQNISHNQYDMLLIEQQDSLHFKQLAGLVRHLYPEIPLLYLKNTGERFEVMRPAQGGERRHAFATGIYFVRLFKMP